MKLTLISILLLPFTSASVAPDDSPEDTLTTMFNLMKAQTDIAKKHHHHGDPWDTFPMEENAWVGSRQGFMSELSKLMDVIPLKSDDQVALLQTALLTHLEHVKSHFDQNEKVLIPKFQEKFEYPHESDESRDARNAHLDNLTKLADELTAGAYDELATELDSYNSTLSEQVRAQEDAFLPLVKEHFTPKDLQGCERDFFTDGSKLMMGSFIDNMGEHKFRNDYMKRLGVPFFVWNMAFKPSFKAFHDKFTKPMEGLSKD